MQQVISSCKQYVVANIIKHLKVYNEDNICRYIDCILYLNYDKTNEFIDYIINEYVLNKTLLEQIKHYDIVKDRINNMCGNENTLTDDILLYLNNHVKITSLNVKNNYKITDESVKHLTNLKTLNANYNTNITDESVKNLINLTHLNVSGYLKITDESVKNLINLTHLNVSGNLKITDESVKNLIHLTSLVANCQITDESVKNLIHLTSLDIGYNNKITIESIKCLINLTSLCISGNNTRITDHIKHLNNLTVTRHLSV